MTKHKMAKTRIYLSTGIHVDVKGDYEIIKELLANTPHYWVHFRLEDDTPVSFQRSWIAYITKR